MNVSLSHDKGQDSCDNELPLPAARGDGSKTAAGICSQKKEKALYDTSGNISSVQLAWSEWICGATTIAQRVRQIKADPLLGQTQL